MAAYTANPSSQEEDTGSSQPGLHREFQANVAIQCDPVSKNQMRTRKNG